MDTASCVVRHVNGLTMTFQDGELMDISRVPAGLSVPEIRLMVEEAKNLWAAKCGERTARHASAAPVGEGKKPVVIVKKRRVITRAGD